MAGRPGKVKAPVAPQDDLKLTSLPGGDYTLRIGIPVQVSWLPESGSYLAVDSLFQWHGQGSSVDEAMLELGEVILGDYLYLKKWPGELAPWLKDRLATMERYISRAGKVP